MNKKLKYENIGFVQDAIGVVQRVDMILEELEAGGDVMIAAGEWDTEITVPAQEMGAEEHFPVGARMLAQRKGYGHSAIRYALASALKDLKKEMHTFLHDVGVNVEGWK